MDEQNQNPPAAPNAAPPPPAAEQWHLNVGSTNYGPYTRQKMSELAAEGRLAPETMVWKPGDAGWGPAGDHADLKSLFGNVPARSMPGVPRFKTDPADVGPDSFMGAVRVCLKTKYATFQGRARRAEFWWYSLFSFLVLFAVFGVTGVIIAASAPKGGDPSGLAIGIFAIATIVTVLGLFLPGLAVSVRRLHDLGFSGWWYLLQFVPVIGTFASFAMFIGYMVRGDKGPNKYGPDPVGD